MILPKVRDPRLVTVRRGGSLTDSDHHLLALWAASCADHVLPFSSRLSLVTRDHVKPSDTLAPGSAVRSR